MGVFIYQNFCARKYKQPNPFRPRNWETKAKQPIQIWSAMLVFAFGFGFPVSGTEGVKHKAYRPHIRFLRY